MHCSKWISCCEQGKVKVHDVREEFATVANSLCNLVCIVGKAREGKSFLMNCLAEKEGLFTVSNSHLPCTQGIDLSSHWVAYENFAKEPQERGDPRLMVGFVDAEGQGDKDITYDANLLCPVLMVSKCVIFNWKGDVQKDQILNSLGIIAKATQNVAQESNMQSNSNASLFGHLHIVFRDWQSGGTDEQSAGDVQDMLFNFEASGPGSDTRNRVRKLILESFKSVRVWLFEPPSEYTKDLKQKLVLEKTSSAFRMQVCTLREALAQQLKEPTYVAGNVLTGRAYVTLTEQIAEALNSGQVVLPSSAYLSMVRVDLQKLLSCYKADLTTTVEHKAAKYKEYLTRRTDEPGCNKWIGFSPAGCEQDFATIVSALDSTYNSRLSDTVGGAAPSPGSPVATILTEYATQSQSARDALQLQFSALYQQHYAAWLVKLYCCAKGIALTCAIEEAADVSEALFSTVSVKDISPLHSGDDPVESYAQSIAEEIFNSIHTQRSVEPWLLSKLPTFRDCIICSDDNTYYYVVPHLSQEQQALVGPAEETQLRREVVFFNKLQRTIDQQAQLFKAAWREELQRCGGGDGDGACTPADVRVGGSDEPVVSQSVQPPPAPAAVKESSSHTATATVRTRHLTTSATSAAAAPAPPPQRKGSFSGLFSRLAVSVEEQRTRAQSWARTSLGLTFERRSAGNSKSGNSKNNISNNKAVARKPRKSFAQQRADALEYARRMLTWDVTAATNADVDTDAAADHAADTAATGQRGEVLEELIPSRQQLAGTSGSEEKDCEGGGVDDFVYVEHDTAAPAVSSAVPQLQLRSVRGVESSPVARGPAAAHPVIMPPRSAATAPVTATAAAEDSTTVAVTTGTVRASGRPGTPLLGSEDEGDYCDADSDSESDFMTIAATDSLLDSANVAPRRAKQAASGKAAAAAPPIVPASTSSTAATAVGHSVAANGNPVSSVVAGHQRPQQTPAYAFAKPPLQVQQQAQNLTHGEAVTLDLHSLIFHQLCLLDIYSQSPRADKNSLPTFLKRETSALTDDSADGLRLFEDRLCRALKVANRFLFAAMVDSRCTYHCTVDFNTDSIPGRMSSLLGGVTAQDVNRSSSPVRTTAEPTCISPGSPASTDTSPSFSTLASTPPQPQPAQSPQRLPYLVTLKDPVVSKASCIFFRLFDRDRFLRAKVAPCTPNTRRGGMRRRYSPLLEQGISLGGRTYHYLCGEGKDRNNCHAYFFATHDECGVLIPISVHEVRQALANFVPSPPPPQMGMDSDTTAAEEKEAEEACNPPPVVSMIANPSKMNARLMLGFSPTFPALQLTNKQVIVIPDVPADGGGEGIMTDGCGFISAALLEDLPFAIFSGVMFCKRVPRCSDNENKTDQHPSSIADDGELYADVPLPNTIQVRFSCRQGLFKGCLVVTSDPALCPDMCVVMRDSMRKVAGPTHISSAAPCTLFVNHTFERASAVDPSCFLNATDALLSASSSNPWTARFSVDLSLLLCHLGLPIDFVLRCAVKEAQGIQNVSTNRSTALDTVHKQLRRADKRAAAGGDGDTADSEDSDCEDEVNVAFAYGGGDGFNEGTSLEGLEAEGSGGELNFQSAKHSFCLTADNAAVKVLHFLVAGHSLQEPQLQKHLNTLQNIMLKKLQKMKFRLPNSTTMVGVPDPYGVLAENEVFVYLPMSEGEVRTTAHVQSCEVLVSRNPMHHPGDIRKLRAVPNAKLSALVGDSSNPVIFFSIRGGRSQADMMGGGDFDGDMYLVIFNQTIVSAVTTVAPYDAAAFPAVQVRPQPQQQLQQQQQQGGMGSRDALGLDLCGSLLHCANNSNVGIYCTAWQAFADRNPASASANICDHLSRLALDAAKTGFESTSVQLPKVVERPHYLAEFRDARVYHSTSVRGVVMDMISDKLGNVAPASTPPSPDRDVYTVVENGVVVFDVEKEIAWHFQRQQSAPETRWELWHRWKVYFDEYRVAVGRLFRGSSSGGGSGGGGSSGGGESAAAENKVKMEEWKAILIERFDQDALNLPQLDVRCSQFTGYTARRVLAALVYHLTYEKCNSFGNTYRVSFCWEICPAELHDNKKRSVAVRARQHEHDLLPVGYFKDMYNFP